MYVPTTLHRKPYGRPHRWLYILYVHEAYCVQSSGGGKQKIPSTSPCLFSSPSSSLLHLFFLFDFLWWIEISFAHTNTGAHTQSCPHSYTQNIHRNASNTGTELGTQDTLWCGERPKRARTTDTHSTAHTHTENAEPLHTNSVLLNVCNRGATATSLLLLWFVRSVV